MKNLVVAAFVLLLAYYGPQRDEASRFDDTWRLGALARLAASLGHVVEAARRPAGAATAGPVAAPAEDGGAARARAARAATRRLR